LALTPRHQSADHTEGSLRRFGLALARDNRLICDDRSALALVETLSRRAALAARRDEGSNQSDSRLRLFSLFIGLYRRHVRMATVEEGAADFGSHARPDGAYARDSASCLARALSNLPLELRESLLLVVLERFSHVEAARALDIPLATLVERLARGRALLAAGLSRSGAAPSPNPARGHAWRRGAPFLRLVK
jgi:RNA polymerase sigma-70 factor, ECF subfamily